MKSPLVRQDSRLTRSVRSTLILALVFLCGTKAPAAGFGMPKLPSIPGLRSVPAKGQKKPTPSEPSPQQAASEPASPPSTATLRRTLRPLVTVPEPPAGADFDFAPMRGSDFAPWSPEEAAQRRSQRTQELQNDLRTIAPIENLPAVGSPAFAKLRAEALAIVQRRFAQSRATLEDDTIEAYSRDVTWMPDFSAAPRNVTAADREKARDASLAVAYTVTHLDRPHFVTAFAAAVFALDPESALGAGNAASAILASGERMHPRPQDVTQLKAWREDAAVVYRYALVCSVEAEKWTLRSLDILVNLGNLYVDMRDADRARRVLLAARVYAPESWEAALALASCYEMQGRPTLARAALEGEQLARPAMYAALARGARNLDETHEAINLSPESPDEAFDPVLNKFDSQETLTAADFVGGLDQSERNRMRYFVDHLPVEGSYRAPGIDGLTQFSTVQSINQPQGIQALGDFAERLGSYSLLLLGSLMKQSHDSLGQMGMTVNYDVDINDVLAHPEKYQDREIHATVSGAGGARARVEERRRLAEQARREMESGRTDALLAMGAAYNPALSIYRLKPYDYANPMDVMIQQYNASVLARKLHAYNAYFFAVNNRTQKSLREIAERHAKKFAAVQEAEDIDLAAFEKQRAAAAAAGQNTNSAHWRMLEHNIHQKHRPQYNTIAEHAWKEATQTAGLAYEHKIKPRAERFYYDVFRHVALISDPAVREKKNEELARILHHAVYQGLAGALMAFGSVEYIEDWDCHCDVGSLLAQAEQERKELDRIADARLAREREAKLRFASGDLPESSPLFKKLDAYGTDLDIPFIPLLSGRISCARTTLKLKAEFPTKYSPKGTYTYTQNALTGATTHSGGIGISVKAEDGGSKFSATLNIKGNVSLDGKGTVSDYSVTASSNVNIEAGPATATAGGEITYTPKGGLNSDVSAGIKAAFSDSKGGSIEVAIDASAQRGSTFSGKAEQECNPYADQMNEAAKEAMGVLSELYPIDTSNKKELWSGSFTL